MCIYSYIHIHFLRKCQAFFSCWGSYETKLEITSFVILCRISLLPLKARPTESHLTSQTVFSKDFTLLADTYQKGGKKPQNGCKYSGKPHTHTCSQIRKHKTNHLLIGRKALAVADETNGSGKEGGKRKHCELSLCSSDIQTKQRQCYSG